MVGRYNTAYLHRQTPMEIAKQVATVAGTKLATIAVDKLLKEETKGQTKIKNNVARKPKPQPKRARNRQPRNNRGFIGSSRLPRDIPYRYNFTPPKRAFVALSGKFKGKDAIIVEGLDYLGTLSVTTANTNYPAFTQPLNPISVPNTRLAIEASLWTKYSFLEAEIIYIPVVSTATSGTILLTHVDDPEVPIPEPATVGYVNALSQPEHATWVQVFNEGHMKWSPAKGDKREFYINPDLQNEDRLTVQANLIVVQAVGVGSNFTAGMLYYRYKVALYNKIISVDQFSNTQSRLVTAGTATSNVSVKMVDNGRTGALTMACAAGENVIDNGVTYFVYGNFSLGGFRAFEIYYWQVGETLTTQQKIYTSYSDAANQTSENYLAGSWLGSDVLPANATLYYTLAGSDEGLVKESPLHLLQKQMAQLTKQMQDLTNNNSKLEETSLEADHQLMVQHFAKLRATPAKK